MKPYHHASRLGGIAAVSALCACATVPGGGPNTLTGKRASITGPAQCAPEPTPQDGAGCEWRDTAGNRIFLTLDEQPLSFGEPVADPSTRLAAALAGFNSNLSTFPGFEGMDVIPESAVAGQGSAWTCAFYGYSQNIGNIPEAPGQTVMSRSFGKLCVDAVGPSDSGWLVIAELGDSWSPSMGGAPSARTPADAQRIMGTLRVR